MRGLVGRGKQQMMTGAAYKYKEPEALFLFLISGSLAAESSVSEVCIGHALNTAAEVCRREGIVFVPMPMETLGRMA